MREVHGGVIEVHAAPVAVTGVGDVHVGGDLDKNVAIYPACASDDLGVVGRWLEGRLRGALVDGDLCYGACVPSGYGDDNEKWRVHAA